MRVSLCILAAAATLTAVQASAAPQPSRSPDMNVEQATDQAMRALNDPRADQTIASAMHALTDTLLNMKVGELKAVIDGRPVTEADRNVTVRDLARRDDPNFEPRLRAQMEAARPVIREKAKALAAALPQLMRSAEDMGKAMERLSTNLPDPTYPRR